MIAYLIQVAVMVLLLPTLAYIGYLLLGEALGWDDYGGAGE